MQPYVTRITQAYKQVEAMGLVGYWRNVYAFMLAAGSVEELEKHWQYCLKVCDQHNPLFFRDLAKATKKRKEELSNASTS